MRFRVDTKYYRPSEVDAWLGEAAKARVKLGCKPTTSFRDLVKEMVAADLTTAERDRLVKDNGYKVDQAYA
jgi:GDPmannose 4,6-dehydratase